MLTTRNLKSAAKSAAIALPLIFGCAAYALAHSEGACANNAVDSCNAAGGSTEAVNLCIINGLKDCKTHSHGGGGGGVDTASDDKAADTGSEQARTTNFLQKLQKKHRRYRR